MTYQEYTTQKELIQRKIDAQKSNLIVLKRKYIESKQEHQKGTKLLLQIGLAQKKAFVDKYIILDSGELETEYINENGKKIFTSKCTFVVKTL